MAKQLMYGENAQRKLREGIGKLAGAIQVTLGPAGNNVILQKKFSSPLVTRDGVTVSKEIELPDPFENMGAKMVNEVASKTNDAAGDGTTTSGVLADAIYREGTKFVNAGIDPMAIKRGLDKACAAAVEALKALAVPISGSAQVERVATIAANQDATIGKLVSQALDKVGKDGVVTVEEGKATETTVEYVEGMRFDKGYVSPYFITDPDKMEVNLEDCYVLLYEKKISNLKEFLPVLEEVARSGKAFLIVCEDIEGEPLATLIINKLKGVLRCVAVKAPGFGDRRKAMLEDMAILCGGTFISEDTGIKLENVKVEHLGRATRVTATSETTTIVGGAGDKAKIDARIKQIKHQIETTTSDYDREKLQERLAKLAGGVAVIKAGGLTEADMKDRKLRVEDAVNAAKAALQEGIVPGGGTALLRVIPKLKELAGGLDEAERYGAQTLIRALEYPARLIAENAGQEGSVVVAELLERPAQIGYDANSGRYVDMIEAGIIDPVKVTRLALLNAVSIGGLLLTTETLITDIKEKEDKEAQIEGSVR